MDLKMPVDPVGDFRVMDEGGVLVCECGYRGLNKLIASALNAQQPCGTCGGSGRVIVMEEVVNGMVHQLSKPCPDCPPEETAHTIWGRKIALPDCQPSGELVKELIAYAKRVGLPLKNCVDQAAARIVELEKDRGDIFQALNAIKPPITGGPDFKAQVIKVIEKCKQLETACREVLAVGWASYFKAEENRLKAALGEEAKDEQ